MIRNFLYKAFSAMGTGEVQEFERQTLSLKHYQTAKLIEIVGENSQSAFGRDHQFASIKTFADYVKNVPIQTYDQHKPYIDRALAGEKSVLTGCDPFMFATTSGTSGQPKYIPITKGYMKEFRRASVVSGYNLLKTFPGISNGVTLSVVSPAEEGRTPGGTPYGAISGQLFLKEPYLIRKFISPIPYDVFLLRDYETRYYTLLRLALSQPLTCFYTLNPSTILMLVKKLKHYAPALIKDLADGTITTPCPLPASAVNNLSSLALADKQRARQLEKLLDSNSFIPGKIWPELQVVACWTKAAAAFYLADLEEYFPSTPICDITYGASEGRGTVFLGPDRQALSLRSHFFEFVPESEIDSAQPQTLLADDLEVGQNYYILFTTSGGLYRYNINDVVKVVGYHNQAPLLEFQYKGGNICSFTGEKITELQVTQAMSKCLQQLDLKIAFFTIIPSFRPEPHYKIWLEPLERNLSRESSLCNRLIEDFDNLLGVLNVEYKSKRESQRLAKPELELIAPGSYESLRRELSGSGVADSQIKVSHLNPKDEIKDYFQKRLYAPAIL